MWYDTYSPGCVYDTIDCKDCGHCMPSPLELYLEQELDDIGEKLIYPKKEVKDE